MPAKPRVGPTFIEPMTAKIVEALPEGEQWSYEVKFDGYRAPIIKDGDRVRILSRNNNDLTRTYPAVAAAATRLLAKSAVLDGEIVAVDGNGRPSFQALQHRTGFRGYTVVYYAFDLIHLDGEDLTREPLIDRQRWLQKIMTGSGILLSSPLPGTATEVIEAVRGLGLEGVIAKRKDSRYQPGLRTQAWLKLKLDKQQEFWGGGVPEEEMSEMQWVKPNVVAQVRFVEWTADGLLRHPAFLGLREDKRARKVVRETS